MTLKDTGGYSLGLLKVNVKEISTPQTTRWQRGRYIYIYIYHSLK